MKKQILLKSVLILLPVLAVGLATTTDSVMVFDSLAGTTEYYSYFALLPHGAFQMITPLAAVLSGISGILAAIYLGLKKQWALKGVVGVSFCAATLAVVPTLLSGDVKIVPNVGLPIFMLIQFGLAYYWLKKPEAKNNKEKLAPRRKKK